MTPWSSPTCITTGSTRPSRTRWRPSSCSSAPRSGSRRVAATYRVSRCAVSRRVAASVLSHGVVAVVRSGAWNRGGGAGLGRRCQDARRRPARSSYNAWSASDAFAIRARLPQQRQWMNAGSRRTYVLSHFGQLPPGAARNRFAARRRVCSGVSRITRFMGREPLYTGNAPGWSAGGLLPSARLRVQERLARVRQPAQERGRLPDVPVPVLHLQHAGLDRLEPHLVCPEHRAAPVDRPAVAVDPDHVDVARADRELLLEDLRSLVHHRVEQALEDLLVRDRAALDRLLPGDLEDNLLDVGIGDRRAVAALVAVIAGAGLLAEAPKLAEAVGDQGALAPPLADPPAHVEAGEVAHRERPHGKSEIVEHLVHLLRERALENEPLRLLAALVEHAVADEAIADADQHRDLADAPADAHRRRDHGLRRLGAAHDLEELHDVGGGEEVHADDALRPRGRPRDLVDVERRGVGGEHRVGLADLVELREDVFFNRHLLEDRLDHDVGVGDRAEVGGSL